MSAIPTGAPARVCRYCQRPGRTTELCPKKAADSRWGHGQVPCRQRARWQGLRSLRVRRPHGFTPPTGRR
eukprot:11528740-Alexandrium_andersonii.AAC.1